MSRRHKGLSFYKRRKTVSPAVVKEISSWIFLFVLAVIIAFIVVNSVGTKTSVIGSSMEPSLYNGEKVLINKVAYMVSNPKRGDVIVFLPNGNQNTHYYIKRVIGLPGETITFSEGKILVDGVYYDDEDAYDIMEDGGIAENGITLGDDEYFVLGDNRNNSEDSRSANIGPVSKSEIIGKAWFQLGNETEKMGFVK